MKNKLREFEEDIFEGKEIDLKEFYRLKKSLLDSDENRKLLELHMILETMLDKQQNELMNKRLNLLTIWSTILGLTILTIVGMFSYFKKNKWL